MEYLIENSHLGEKTREAEDIWMSSKTPEEEEEGEKLRK